MKQLLKLAASFVLGFALYGHAWSAPLVIHLSEGATVVGPNITIGEIADLIGSGNGDVERVRRLQVGRAAPAGDTATITQQYIKISLRRAGMSLDDFQFEGTDSTKVLTQSQSFQPSSLLPEIKKFVLKQVQEEPANVSVKLMGQDKSIVIPAGKVKPNFRPVYSGKYEGDVLLTTDLNVNDRLERVLPLHIRIEISRLVVVTTKRVEKGDKFTPDNVALTRTPTSKLLPGSLSQLNYVTGRTAAIPLVPGTVVRVSDIYDPPVVVHGKTVQGIVHAGNIELIVDVRAIEDGKPGDEIRVENTESHKLLRAKVLDEKTVLILQDKS